MESPGFACFYHVEMGSSLDELQAASIQYRIAVGPHAGRMALTLFSTPSLEEEPFVGLEAKIAGFSLHAGTVCEVHQRGKLERLCRYITRPAIATPRLSVDDRGRVVYRYKRLYKDGSTHVVLEPLDFIARLAALVPRPSLTLTRFHGVFAPNFKHRHKIIARRPRRKVDSDKPQGLNEFSSVRTPHGKRKALARGLDSGNWQGRGWWYSGFVLSDLLKKVLSTSYPSGLTALHIRAF